MSIAGSIATDALVVPAHVPPDCVWNHNFAAFLAEGSNPYLAASRLHEGPGIIWAPTAGHGQPAWIFTRHALIEEGFFNWEMFSSKRVSNAAVKDSDWLLLPVEADRPEHHHYRKILMPAFTPRAISNRATAVQQLCDELVAAFIARGECEFISEFAAILPNAIVISLMGMPREMLSQFLVWENDLIHGETNEARQTANDAIIAYLKTFIAEKQAHPEQATEVMRAVLTGGMPDRAFTSNEILGFVYLLFVAGLDTVEASMGWIMHKLATDQALQQRLRNNRSDIPAAIEEFSRAFGVSAPSRTVSRDMEFHGVPMKAGETVLLPTFLAGRDPNAWVNPHVVDIDRKPRHVTFGTGPHICLGIHLAKREMNVMLDTFLSRMNNIRLKEGGRFSYHTTNTIGIDRLDLTWDAA